MAVTQKEIAERLDISRSLVARALKGHTEVAESTRLRIQKAAQEMGYDTTTNSAARELINKRYGQTSKNGVIAVMYGIMNAATPRSLPFYVQVFDGIEAECHRLGLDLCLCLVRPDHMPRLIREGKVDGVISFGYETFYVDPIQAAGMPVVLFHTHCQTVDTVAPDDYEAARLATRHLIELGHRRIGFLGVRHYTGHASQRRLEAFRDEMAAHGIPIDEKLVNFDLHLTNVTTDSYCNNCGECAGCIGWQTLLAENGCERGSRDLPFTALLCYNDAVAMGVIEHAREDGLEVPRDFSVVGFDDISVQYRFSPAITSVDIHRAELGAQAVRLLNKIIEQAGTSTAQERHCEHPLFPVSLSVRESTRNLEASETAP